MKSSGTGLAVVAGSGMGPLADRLAGRLDVESRETFDRIAGLGACTVDGHRGEVVFGRAPGAGRRVAVVSGRRHVYEGPDASMAPLVDRLRADGFTDLVTVSAAGSVHGAVDPGELVVIQEIIDLQNRSRFYPRGGGPVRFRPSRRLTRELEEAARRARRAVLRGTLACGAGPCYETPAEIRALQVMDADVATMSAAPEAQFAIRLGMEVAIIAAVTNRGTGIGRAAPDHAAVVVTAGALCDPLADILGELV